jgi:hypothetical protein
VIAEAAQETTWQRAVHHPVSLLGFLIVESGSIVSNIAIAKTMNIANESEIDKPSDREMFATSEETETRNVGARRAEAIKKYRRMQPRGQFYKMLHFGYVLSGIGFLVVIMGIFI